MKSSTADEPNQSADRIAIDSAVVTALNFVLHVANFVVFASIAARFGASWQTDAFFLAMTIPTFFVGAVVNAIANVLIPILAECRRHRPHAIGQLIGSALLWLFALSAAAAAAVFLFAPSLLRLSAPDLSAAGREMALDHTTYLLPLIACNTTAAVLTATFNVSGKFWIPPATDFAGTLATATLIVLLGTRLGIAVLPAAFVAGSLLHLLLLAALWPQLGLRLAFRWRLEPDLARSFRLALPLILGVAALQLGVAISRFLAAQLSPGSVSVLDYASRLAVGVMELLTGGVFLVTLTDWSRIAAENDMPRLRLRLRQTIRMVLFVVLPAVAILVALRAPLIRIALERGAFDPHLTALTSAVLLFFLLGIPADVIARTYARLFLVWQDTWTLGALAALRLVAGTLLALALLQGMELPGLALADGVAILLVTVCLIARSRRRLGATLSGLGLPLGTLALIAAGAGGAAAVTHSALGNVSPFLGLPAAAVAGGLSYLVLARLLRVEELGLVTRLITRFRATPA